MTPMDELPHNPYEQGLDESAYQGAADVTKGLVSTAGNALLQKVLEEIGFQKLKLILLEVALGALLFILVFLMLFGGASYLQALGEDLWQDILHWNVGDLDDDYQTTYYDQAKAVLDAINNGSMNIDNDMAMLTKADLVMILEYIIQYNEETSYETTPEKIRYQYNQRSYSVDTYSIPENAGPDNPVDESKLEYIPNSWEKVYGFHTVSYQTLGSNYQNLYTGDNEFAVPWQTIVVLCEMMAESNYENFGSNEDGWETAHAKDFSSDLMFETSMDGYYVTDAQVNALCHMVSFTYNIHTVYNNMDYVQWTKEIIKDGNAHYQDDLSYGIDIPMEDIHKYTYEIKAPYSTGERATKKDYANLRIPELAPYSISNFYTLVTYEYEETPTVSYGDVDMCSSMTITTDARRFMMMVQNLIPDFTFKHFYELMALLPGTEKEIAKYRKIEELYNKGEQARIAYENQHNVKLELADIEDEQVIKSYQNISRSTAGFPGKGIVIGEEAQIRDDGGDDFEGANAVWIGTHYDEDGNVAKSPRLSGQDFADAAYNDWFQIDYAANLDMSHSDELSLDDTKLVLGEVASWVNTIRLGGLEKLFAHEDTAQALYDWQNDNDASITAVLAIARIEGELGFEGNAHKNWNFFNYGTTNYKDVYTELYPGNKQKAFTEALLSQMNSITNNYLKNNQSTYFKMQFGAEFTSDTPGQEYYGPAEKKITHSYCPWWDDCSFPFLARNGIEGEKMTGEGWCNSCADSRRDLLAVTGRQIEANFVWPVPDYTRVSSEFGPRKSPTPGGSTDHKGMDIAAPKGSDILAITDGTVINDTSVWSSTVGYSVRIMHSDGITQSRYIHMEEPPLVNNGDTVAKGQKIAEVGSGGISTGPHLHIEVKEYGVLVDPRKYITEPIK